MRLGGFLVLVSLFGPVVSYGDIAKLVAPLLYTGGSIAVAAELPIIRKPSLQSPSTTGADTSLTQLVLNPQQREALASMGRMLARNPTYGSVEGQWVQVIRQLGAATGGPAIDVNALVQLVLRESYLQTTKDLESYADKVKYFNDLKKKLRAEREEARRQRAQPSTVMQPTPGRAPAATPQVASPAPTSRSSLPHTTSAVALSDLEIRNLDSRLAAAEKDEQLANMELQNLVNKRQQTLALISNVAKKMHDTAISIIQRIGS